MEALEILMNDELKPFVPQYYGKHKDHEGNGEYDASSWIIKIQNA